MDRRGLISLLENHTQWNTVYFITDYTVWLIDAHCCASVHTDYTTLRVFMILDVSFDGYTNSVGHRSRVFMDHIVDAPLKLILVSENDTMKPVMFEWAICERVLMPTLHPSHPNITLHMKMSDEAVRDCTIGEIEWTQFCTKESSYN